METNELNEKIVETSKRISEIEAEIKHYEALTFWAQAVLKELRITLDNLGKAKRETWIAAIGNSRYTSGPPARLILNLTALSNGAKKQIKEALDKEAPWISFGEDGEVGAFGDTPKTGLLFYGNTNIIFGGK